MKKRCCAVLFAMMLIVPVFSACTGKKIEGIDPNKTQIYVGVYNGGFGSAYLAGVKNRFETDYPDYELIIDGEQKREYLDIYNTLKAGTEINDVFITCFPETQGLQAPGYLEDISDVWEMTPVGETETIENKMKNSDLYQQIFKGATDDGLYGLPWSDSMVGFVFDFELFKENGWLLYAQNDETTKASLAKAEIGFTESGNYLIDSSGEKILSLGKDGKPGTYDDGQPITESEWRTMVKKISVRADTKVFLWPGNYPDYVNDIFDAAFVQYDGVANAEVFNTFSGTYTNGDVSFEVKEETGYLVNQMTGRKKALDFVNEYLVNTEYRHGKAESGTSNTDAQDLFLMGYEKSKSNPETAFLIDGCWWENEARGTFEMPSIVNDGRGYGKREYRYMLLPDFSGQLCDKSVLSTRQAGAIMVKKQTDEAKKAMIKEFLRYLVSDQNVKSFVTQTNGLLPYKVELNESEYNLLTPFMKNVWDMYRDEENILIFRPKVERLKSRLNYVSASKPKNDWFSSVEGFTYKIPLSGLQALRDNGTSDPTGVYMAGMLKYNRDRWETFLSELGE